MFAGSYHVLQVLFLLRKWGCNYWVNWSSHHPDWRHWWWTEHTICCSGAPRGTIRTKVFSAGLFVWICMGMCGLIAALPLFNVGAWKSKTMEKQWKFILKKNSLFQPFFQGFLKPSSNDASHQLPAQIIFSTNTSNICIIKLTALSKMGQVESCFLQISAQNSISNEDL